MSVDAARWKSLKRLCMQADIHRLQQRWQTLDKEGPQAAGWAEWNARVEASIARRESRERDRPALNYPESLPVVAARETLLAALRDHQVVIIAGETGSGKTTQIPKLCLELGRGVRGLIGHTQPRRLAARTIAARIADELESPPGQWVGHKIRFQDTLSPSAYIKVMTDGILLAEMAHDRFLDQYDTLIIDEAHERSLTIDFLLGYLKRLLPRRPDLKVIITSATIDPGRFARHFNDAPVVEVSGRSFPVEVLYRPLDTVTADRDDEPADDESRLESGILAALDDIDALERASPGQRPGGVLVFLPGEGEIRRVATRLRRAGRGRLEVLPLYSRLAVHEQNRIFDAPQGRRVVLATNVAETSVTVPHIGYVIDSGLARISRYSVRTKVQRLPIEGISQASARQRAGRCGRTAPGVCIRLYAEDDLLARPAFTEPEILRTPLASVILQMAGLRLGEVAQFPFIDPPDGRAINDGYRLLEDLGALDARRALTPVGRQMLRLPLDPRVARLVVASVEQRCLTECLVIAASLSVQDIGARVQDGDAGGDDTLRALRNETSDFLTHWRVWQVCEAQRVELSGSAFRRWLLSQGIAYLRYNELREVHRQLRSVALAEGWSENTFPAEDAAVHKAVLSGYATQVGMREDERVYRGTRGRRFTIARGSVLASRRPKWIVAADLVETRTLQARCVAQVDPDWIEEAAAGLLKRRYFEPHWEKRQGAVIAFEETSLYGLVVCPRRRRQYSAIDPVVSRELFIRHALVAGEWDCRAPFFLHNRALMEAVAYREEKLRRRDLVVDDEAVFQWFDARIPAGIADTMSFDTWRKSAERQTPRLLFLSEADLVSTAHEDISESVWPDSLPLSGTPLKIEYCFDPGRESDGITVEVPVAMLNQVTPGALEWLVPGLEREKVIALIKSLPKALRKHFVPAPEYATAFLATSPDRSQSLRTQLAGWLRQRGRQDVQPVHFNDADLPPHLTGRIRVIDEQGATLAEGRDLLALQRDTRARFREVVDGMARDAYQRNHFTAWTLGELPEEQLSARGALVIRSYPTLVDQDTGVAIEWCERREDAEALLRLGVLRLLLIAYERDVRQWVKKPPFPEKTLVQYAPFGNREDLGAGYARAVLTLACLHERPLPRNAEAFAACVRDGRQRLGEAGRRIRETVADLLDRHHRLMMTLAGSASPAREDCYRDVRGQLSGLLPPRWLAVTDYADLLRLPRYLQGIEVRLSRLQGHIDRDRASVEQWQPWQVRHQRLLEAWRSAGMRPPAEVMAFRWWLEEWRLQLFAQGIKTREPVSERRIAERFSALPTPG